MPCSRPSPIRAALLAPLTRCVLAIAHGNGRLLAVLLYPHPAVLRVRGRRMLPIFLAQLAQLVRLDRLPLGLRINGEELGRVEAEDLVLDRIGQVRVLVLV